MYDKLWPGRKQQNKKKFGLIKFVNRDLMITLMGG